MVIVLKPTKTSVISVFSVSSVIQETLCLPQF